MAKTRCAGFEPWYTCRNLQKIFLNMPMVAGSKRVRFLLTEADGESRMLFNRKRK